MAPVVKLLSSYTLFETPDDNSGVASLRKLIARYMQPQTGYTARRAMFETNFPGDYDHLSRFGEWGAGDAPKKIKVGDHG